MANFTFNNKHNYFDMDCLIISPIAFPIAIEEVEEETIEGSITGSVTRRTGTFKDITIKIKLQLNDINSYEEEYKEKVQEITEWLFDIADNKLIFDDNKEKCYLVKRVEIDEFEDYKKFYSRFTVNFICQPFLRYCYEPTYEVSRGQVIFNNGSIESRPYIELELPDTESNIQVIVNENILQINNAKGNVIIDCLLLSCRNEEGNLRTIGNFPTLIKGNNSISWTGTINKFRIKNNFMFRG